MHEDPRSPTQFANGTFETWLSSLAEPQPYLSEHLNLENQALFLRFSDAIGAVLGRRVDKVLNDPAPSWLMRFLTAAHCRRATLITFNYDPLVECAIATRRILTPNNMGEPVAWTELLGNVPAWAPGVTRFMATPVETFRLLKLHGSLNWYWSPGDASGISMARRGLPGSFGAPMPYQDVDRRRELPGRVPFVVPPSATKSAYYRNPIVREVWTQAARALEQAKTVRILGYSLPLTDLTFTGMLARTLRNSPAPISVADVAPDPIIDRLTGLGFDRERVTAESDPHEPILTMVERFCRESSVAVVGQLQTCAHDTQDDPLVVAWHPNAFSSVVAWSTDGDDIVFQVEEPTDIHAATKSRPETTLPTLREVLSTHRPNSVWRIRDRTGVLYEVVDWMTWSTTVGYGRGSWNMLTPSGPATT